MGSDANTLYTVRTPDGLELGPVRRETVLDLLKSNKILGNESVNDGGESWTPISEHAAFREELSAGVQGKTLLTDLDDLPELDDDEPAPAEPEETALEIDDTVALTDESPANAVSEEEEQEFLDELAGLEFQDGAGKPTNQAPGGAQATQAEPLELEELEPIEADTTPEIIELQAEPEPLAEVEIIEPVAPKGPPPLSRAVAAELKNPDNRYTIRDSDGLVLGPVRIATIRDLMEIGKVIEGVDISKNGGEWAPLSRIPELAYLLAALRAS